jgi:hypothetical protein
MKKNPSWVITIEGHCDERGTAEYNLALGERRAIAVKTFLVSLGFRPTACARSATARNSRSIPGRRTRHFPTTVAATLWLHRTDMRKMIPFAFAAALAAAAPARAQNREHLQMAAELTILRQQNQELANTLAQMIQLLQRHRQGAEHPYRSDERRRSGKGSRISRSR